MSKRDELINKYAADIKEKIGEAPDMEFLTKVTIACGPSIYRRDSAIVSGRDHRELQTVKQDFLIKKLGLDDGPELDQAIEIVMDRYGRSNRNKYRAVVYYLLSKHFRKENVYVQQKVKNKQSSKENPILSFGESFIKSQKNIDSDIKKIVDDNFSKLL